MDLTKQDAEAMLKDAGAIETAVRARAPQEYPLYVCTGLNLLFIGLANDLVGAGGVASGVGATLALVTLVVTVGINLAYWRRYRQVRIRSTPKWLEWVLVLWSLAALVLIGILLDGTIGFSFTLGGVVGAAPFMVWAQRLRGTA